MYLSQLTLNPRHRQVWSEMAQPYEMHRTLTTRCFDSAAITAQKNVSRAKAEDAHGLLFRLDVLRSTGDLVLLAQSKVRPEWGNLPEGYVLNVQGPKDFDLQNKFTPGQSFGFRLRASPTKRIGSGSPFKEDIGKRVGIKDPAEQLKWLERKGEQHGFKLTHSQINPETVLHGRKDGYAMQWLSVCFEGALLVQDAAQFRGAVAYGIGTAKGMGFGLLSLAYPQRPAASA